MILSVTIGILALLIGLNGLLYQPKRDAAAPATWSNINLVGKFLFVLLILINVLNIVKNIYDSHTNEVEIGRRQKELNQLMDSQQELRSAMESAIIKQEELKQINQHLIKVMSVADGYNAVIRGTVTFRRKVSDLQIRDAINNLFLKYAEVEIEATNKLGRYEGKIDHASHPEVRKFLSLSEGDDQDKDNVIVSKYRHRVKIPTWLYASYYFEVRCAHIKILNRDKIQYARFRPDEMLKIRTRKFDWSGAFGRIYGVSEVFIDDIEIEELGSVPIGDVMEF